MAICSYIEAVHETEKSKGASGSIPELVGAGFATLSSVKTIRYRCSLNSKLCRLGIGRPHLYESLGTLREIKVFGFWGEYGRKAET